MLFLITLCIGELYQIHATEFPINDVVRIRLQEDESKADIYYSLQEAAVSNNISAYISDVDLDSSLTKTIVKIYCSDEQAKSELKDTYSIFPGSYDSVFLSTTDISIGEIKDYPNDDREINIFLAGNLHCKQEFVDNISGDFNIISQIISDKNESFYTTKSFIVQSVLWAFACTILAAIGLYEAIMKKREIAVKYSLGDSLFVIYLKNIFIDSLIFLAIFVTILFALSKYTNSFFSWRVSLVMFAIFLVVNCVSMLPMLKVRIKKAFAAMSESGSLLSASYALKIISCVLTVIVTASCFGLISEVITAKKQSSFFEKYREYKYIEMVPSSVTEMDSVSSAWNESEY